MASTKKQRGTSPRLSVSAKKKTKKKAAPKKTSAPKKKKAPATKKAAPNKPIAKQVQAEKLDGSQAPEKPGAVRLGEITTPSGTLAIFDVGLMGYLPREALEPSIIKATVPSDRALPVIGTRVGTGRFSDCWDNVSVIVGDGEITHAKKLGEAGVDFARLILIDHGALDHWQHEDSLDGKADFIFWGKDELILARVTGAPKLKEGYGWTNIAVADAEAKADLADRKKAENSWKLQTDLRPHTHHFHALAAARASKDGAGAMELAGTQLLLVLTSWGDGVFPIYLDLDAANLPVRVRIQLATAESNAAKRAVNR
jgi:hypothetical protein